MSHANRKIVAAVLNVKSWNGLDSRKGYAKRIAAKAVRRAHRALCREALSRES